MVDEVRADAGAMMTAVDPQRLIVISRPPRRTSTITAALRTETTDVVRRVAVLIS